MKKIVLTAMVAMVASTNLWAQDTVTTTTAAPTTDLLASQAAGGAQYLVDAARDPGQGQTFLLASDFMFEAVTVQVSNDTRGAQNAAEDAAALSLNLYQLPIDPMTGAPVLTLDATTLLGSFNDPTAATFDASTGNPLFLTFDLDPASTTTLGTLTANTVYAFTITSNSTTDAGFRIERSLADDFVDGQGIFTGGNGTSALQPSDAVFFIQGTVVGAGILGDVNCDGVVSFLDIGPFIDLLANSGFSTKADINGDAVVSFLDIGPFITILSGG